MRHFEEVQKFSFSAGAGSDRSLRKKGANTDIFFSVFSRIPNGIQEKTEIVIFVYRIPVQTNRDSNTAF